jgi:hypothetical protein
MTKKIGVAQFGFGGTATVNNWKASTKQELLNNSGPLPLRVDKLMMGVTCVHTHSNEAYVGCIVHLSDTNGNTVVDTIDGSGADATSDLNTLLEKWKDYVWMTDFRLIGTGVAGLITNYDMEANTKRILEPNQKLYCSMVWMAGQDTSAKMLSTMLDYGLWYQQASQT